MRQPTILHVEDDPNDVLLLQHACRRLDGSLVVKTVSDGDEAIAYLTAACKAETRASHPLPDLLLLDLKMPRLDGFEFLSWLRQRKELCCIPVVVLTSSNHQGDVRHAYELGANSYLVKPVSFDDLVGMIEDLHHYWFKLNHRPEKG